MNNRLLAILVVAVAASGCSGDKAGGNAPAAVAAPVVPGADAVAAVLQSEGAPVAKLGFAVVARPVAGIESDLRLDLTSAEGVPVLQVHVEAQSVTIDPATAKAGVALEAGKTLSHLVRLTPQRDGLAEITVRLRADGGGAETVYVIPVLVGATAGGG